MLTLTLALLAAPPRPAVEGLDKPKKVQTRKLGKSELMAGGTVTVKCFDAGKVMVAEVHDPGLMGAANAWLKKKEGDALPPCDGNDTDGAHLEPLIGFGHVVGVKGDFLFAQSADNFGDREGLRVFSLPSGALVLDVERSVQQPATVRVQGERVVLRYHEAVAATCDPVGEGAARCWAQIRDAAKVPVDVDIAPPPCGKYQMQLEPAPGGAQVALPVEVDLSSPKSKRYVAGQATCSLAP
jgi:hypothetical protein